MEPAFFNPYGEGQARLERLRPHPARPQAPLQARLIHAWSCPDGTTWTGFYRNDSAYWLRFPDLADFQLSLDGEQLQAWPVPGVDTATLEHLYLNQVLPLALSKQGKLVLHGSAVEIGGGAIAFIGQSGRGKSTLAASFANSGWRVLTDDGLLLEADGETYHVLPGHPSIRLWQDSETALMSAAACKARPLQFTRKARFLAADGMAFCDQPRRLHRVYFLGEGLSTMPVFAPMPSAEIVIELLKHSFLLDIEERELLARHFDQLAKLANQPLFYRLDFPRNFASLPTLRQAIIQHATTQGTL